VAVYRVVHRDHDGPVPDDVDWYVEEDGRDQPMGHFRTERLACLFLSDYLRYLAGMRKRPASTAQKYL